MVTRARRRGYEPYEAWRWPLRQASLVGLGCALLLTLSFGSRPARGQPEPVRAPLASEASTTDRPNPETSFKERTPQIIYAPDAQGNPVPLINVPLERIQELLDQADGILEQQQPPRFQLNRLQIDGQATEDRATFDVQITVTTITDSQSDSGWISIPLRFHEAVLRAPPVYEGAGQLLLVYDPARGYVAWIQQPDRGEHQIRLRFDIGLSRIAQTTQLRFYPPLANISQFSLQVPGNQISADLQNGQDLQVQPTEGAGWRLTACDLQNEVVLVWRDGGRLVREQPVQLDVRGDIRVLIDGPGAIRTELALDLQSFNRPVETFLLRLPPHTTLVTGNTQGYEVSDLTDPEAVDRADRQTVQITLQKPATQARIQLTAQSNAEADPSDQLDVANYEVRDALRQSGQVSLWASEDWLVDWSMGAAVRRVAGVERMEGSEERRQLAAFEYFRQPCDLKVQVAPQGTRKEVDPLYTMRINEDRVTLEARLRYRIRGARESFLEFDRNDWQLDDVGPAGEVEVDNWDEETPARVQLKLKRPASGELEVVLTLHRRITQPQGKLNFPLPWPVADTTTGGLLIVHSAPAIELNYRLPEMTWLVQDVVPEEQLLPGQRAESGQQPAAFRFRSDRAIGNVSIEYEVRPQEITVRADTEIELTADRADVEQRFVYRIEYQPATRLTLDFPRRLIDLLGNRRYRNQIAFEVDGESQQADALIDAVLAAESTQPIVPITVALPQLKLGTVEVSLAYPWPIRSSNREEEISVLLASPRDGRIVANTATLTPIGPLRVQAVTEDGFWSSDAGANRSDPLQTILLSSTSRPSQISLLVGPQQEPRDGSIPPGATVVRRAWLQSWLGREERLDRLVYQIATGAERVVLELPPGVNTANAVTLVDGVEVTPLASGQELTVPLDRRPGGEHTLEVSLPFPTRPRWGRMRFPLPKLLDATPPQRWFWQLVLPADEHLLVDDPQSTAAHRWIQSGWFWRRETPNAQRTLEQWTDASQQPLLPDGTNRYLYSSFESLDQLQVYTCPRRLLVYGSSAALLLIGLALIYVRWLRHPLTLLLLALGILILAWRFPATAVLVAQASVLGGVFGLIALLLAAVLRPRPRGPVPVAPSGLSRSDTRSGGSPIWPERAGTLSTATAPSASVPAPVPDGDL